jgi:hypothetical protein
VEYLLLRAQKDPKYKNIPQDFYFYHGNPPVDTRMPPQILAAYPDKWPEWVANPLNSKVRRDIRSSYNEWLENNLDKVVKDVSIYNMYVARYEANTPVSKTMYTQLINTAQRKRKRNAWLHGYYLWY